MIGEWVWYCHHQSSAPSLDQWLELPVTTRRAMTRHLNRIIQAHNDSIT